MKRLALWSSLASLVVVAALVVGAVAAGADTTVTVSQTVAGTADIFAAGLAAVPALPGGGGTLPNAVVAGDFTSVQFPSVTGIVGCTSYASNGPDGSCFGASTNLTSSGGISGLVANSQMMLVGVFTNGTPPAAPAPAALTFANDSFTSVAPALNQQFFIGNGRVGAAGALQTFTVPTGATTLYLGFADGFAFVGAPGYYDDNVGNLSVSVAGMLTTAALLRNLGTSSTGVGPGSSLGDKVATVQGDLAAGEVADACGTLAAYVHEVNAQTGHSIPAAVAANLIAQVAAIQARLGC